MSSSRRARLAGGIPRTGTLTARAERRWRTTLVAALAVGGLALAAGPAHAQTFTVFSTNDAGPGSLGAAITAANAQAGADRIRFLIPGAGPHTITLAANLPTVTETLSIDGYTQPGAVPGTKAVGGVAEPKIVIDATAATVGLELTTNGSVVRGLVVHGATGFLFADGIRVQGARNRVEGNFVGTDVAGQPQAGLGNDGDGVQVDGDDNVVGGLAPEARNVIADNGDAGVRIGGPGSTGNVIRGNLVGTDVTGTVDAGNDNGVVIAGDRNVVGGAVTGARNVIADNFNAVELNGDLNRVEGNAIGTDISTTVELDNFHGVLINGDDNVVGGSAVGAGNVISGNSTGVVVASGTSNRIAGNVIGPDETGLALPAGFNNQDGIRLESSGNVVGGPAEGEGNLVSGNGIGIQLMGDHNDVLGNQVGTTIDGDAALPNGNAGIDVSGHFNQIGGPAHGEGNLVSGNDAVAIEISGTQPDLAVGNTVRGNLIGTDAAGAATLPNTGDGVMVEDATLTEVGGVEPGEGNVIAGNTRDGVHLQIGWGTVVYNTIAGNAIGTDATGERDLGNGGSGVDIDGGIGTDVGAIEDGGANTVAYNDDDGVTVEDGSRNALLTNAIFANEDLGIDLDDDGVSSNDPSPDLDTGANDLQNHPVVHSASVVAGDPRQSKSTTTTVHWTLDSEPSTPYRIEFFASPSCDDPASGQARTFLGAVEVTTDLAGHADPTRSGTVLKASALGGAQITATATPLDPVSDNPVETSELSACTAATVVPPPR